MAFKMLQIDVFPYLGGIFMSLLSTVIMNYAPLLQKIALSGMAEIKSSNIWKSIKVMFTSKKWLLGMILGTIGGFIYFLAIEIAGVTVVQPLLNFGFIVLAIMANRMLGERFDRRSKVAIGLLVCMPVCIAFSAVSSPRGLMAYDTLIIFMVIFLILMGVFVVLASKIPILWAFSNGICLGLGGVFVQWFTLVFFEAFQSTGNPFLAIWIAIIPFVFMDAFTIIPNLIIGQIGLQRNPASRFNPLSGTINMIVTVLGGMLIFNQSVGNWICYGIAITLGVIGIMVLSKLQIPSKLPVRPTPAGK